MWLRCETVLLKPHQVKIFSHHDNLASLGETEISYVFGSNTESIFLYAEHAFLNADFTFLYTDLALN